VLCTDSPERESTSEYVDDAAESGCESSEEEEEEEIHCDALVAAAQRDSLAVQTPERIPTGSVPPSIKIQRKLAQSAKKPMRFLQPVPFDSETIEREADEMLDDMQLGKFQHILRSLFPSTAGWQPPVLASLGTSGYGFQLVPTNSVQIMNNLQLHWLVSARTSAGIFLADSLKSEPNQAIIDQLITLYGDCKSNDLLVEYVPCQRQKGSLQCGDFAAVNAALFAETMTCNREALLEAFSSAHTDQAEMRDHFQECLAASAYTPFPRLAAQPTRTIERPIQYSIDCRNHCFVRVTDM